MAEKLGNGGHGYENYDPETGRYIAMDKLSSSNDDFVRKNVSDWGETEIELFKRKMAQRRENRNTFTNRKAPKEMNPVDIIKEINELRPNVEKYFSIDNGFENACKDKRQLLCMYRALSQNLKDFPGISSLGIRLRHSRAGTFFGQVKYDFAGSDFRKTIVSSLSFAKIYTDDSEQYYKDMEYQTKVSKYKVDRLEEKYGYATVDHEFGHVLFGKIISDRLGPQKSVLDFRVAEHEIVKEIKKIWQEDNPGKDTKEIVSSMSGYGNSSNAEFLAETFSSMRGGKPLPIAKAMEKWLKQNYNKGGNENE